MGQEIERKYLVTGGFKQYADHSFNFIQGYLSIEKENTVRVRLSGEKAWITIKGEQRGISRFEWEKEIPVKEATELLALCSDRIVEKTRYFITYGAYTIEVDVFTGRNKGLILAEIELQSEDDNPDLPSWIGEEVSNDNRYHNSNLSINPYSNWNTT